MLRLDQRQGVLSREDGSIFDLHARCWRASDAPAQGQAVDAEAVVRWLQFDSGSPLRQPIGVIGPSDASEPQRRIAEELGARIAALGLNLVCGGRGGVMAAACRGAASRGGISVGLLPGTDVGDANPYVTVPLATGIGEARNALVARAAFCLVAIGNNYGTLSEVALGLQFGRLVLGLAGAATIEGVQQCADVDEAARWIAAAVLDL
jgi:uncharacterized protein (TIGR00725 family)